jgi:hypothetical protein
MVTSELVSSLFEANKSESLAKLCKAHGASLNVDRTKKVATFTFPDKSVLVVRGTTDGPMVPSREA